LDSCRNYPAVWVTGPAGAGKTTLIASYMEVRRLPCLWYQVGAGDADPATFFYYMGIGARKAASRFRSPLPLLTPEYALGIQVFAKRYFESLFGRLPQPFALVLDNYQEAPADSALHEIIATCLTAIPAGLQVVVISRSEPPAPFARFQANSEMMSIGWDELRLTLEELSEVMRLQCAGPLPKETVRSVYEKTGGWAAGAVLLCQAVKMEAADSGTIRSLQPERVFDYFSNELFSRADARIQEFLLKTALVPNLTQKIAEELSGRENAGQILSELNRRNFFTEKRTQPEPTYQYHPLFREFLLSRARKTFSSEAIAALQQNAARMLVASGQVDDAVELYRESRDWQGMIRLILQNARALVTQGRSETLERWILSLPEGMRKAAPWLLYWRGICRLARDPLEARQHFCEAYALFKRLRDRTGLLLSWSGAVDTYIQAWDIFTPLKQWVRELKAMLKQKETFPSLDIEVAATVRMFTALFFIQPQDRDLPAWEQKMITLLDRAEDPDQRLMLSVQLLFYYSLTGEVEKMHALMQGMDARTFQRSVSPAARILWLGLSSVYYWFRAEGGESLRLVEEVLELSEKYGFHVMDTRAMTQAVFASLGAGDLESAKNYLNRMQAALNPKQPTDVAQYHYISAYYFAIAGELDKSREHAVKGAAGMDETGAPFMMALGNACLAQVHILRNEFREAAFRIDSARKAGRQMHSVNVAMQVHLLEAQIALARGNEQRMVRALRKGLAIGREKGFMGIAWWLPSVLETLGMKAIEYGIETEYVRELIRKRNFAPKAPPHHLENWPWPVKVYTFGRFSLLEGGRPLRFSGKTQTKPLEMLKAVIALGGREVSEQQIIDALWPDAEGDAGRMLFKTTLHRLRQLMGGSNAIAVHEGRLTLDNRLCWVDAWAFERFLGEAERLWTRGQEDQRTGRREGKTAEAAKLTEKALALYQGPLLEADCNEPWTVPQREHLRVRYIRAVGRLGRHWEQTGEYEKAADCYQSALRVDELTEEFYQHLMICYRKLGRKAEAVKTYRRCCAALKANMGVEPSAETVAIYRNIMQ
jgi:two-component SAPR family response regulator